MGFDIHIRTKGIISLKRFLKTIKKETINGNIKPDTEKIEKIDLDVFFYNMKVFVGDSGNGLEIAEYDEQSIDVDREYLEYVIVAMLLKAYKSGIIDKYLKIFEDDGEWSFNNETAEVKIFYKSSYKGGESIDIDFRKVADDIEETKSRFSGMLVDTELGMS